MREPPPRAVTRAARPACHLVIDVEATCDDAGAVPGPEHLNLKARFSERRGTSKRFGMAQALRAAGLPLAGTHHRGIDDARNIARLLPFIV